MYKVDIFTDKLEYASFAMIDGNQNIELDYLAFDAYTIETRLIECKKGYFVHITEDNEFVCDGIVSDVKPDKATQQISIKPIQTMFDEEVFYTPVNDAITWLATNINNTYLNNADTYQNRPINLTYTTYSESFPLTGFNLHETINILSVMISALKTHGVVVDCSLDLPNKHIKVDIHKSDSIVRETTVSEIEVYDGQITTTQYYYAYLLNSDSQAQPARTICTNVINAINNYPNARRFVKVIIDGTEFIKEYTGTSVGDPGYYDFGGSYFKYSDLGVNDISFHFSNRPSEWALAVLVYNPSGPYVNKTVNIKVTFYAVQNADSSIDPLYIRADLDNVIESSVTLGDSYGSKNKAEIQKTKTVDDETTYHGVTNFYLHNDGSIDSTDSNRVWPVFRSIENLEQDDDMTDQDWLDAALARAKEILEPQKYDNEIMLTYSKFDKLIHPNDIPIGREVIIYLKGNTYASVLTGKRIKGNEITLIFGVVRTEFTKKLSIEEREKLTFQNTVSAVIAEADDRYVSSETGTAPNTKRIVDYYTGETAPKDANITVKENGGLLVFESQGGITTNKPPHNGHIIHFPGSYASGNWQTQLAISDAPDAPMIIYRAKDGSGWSNWLSIAGTWHTAGGISGTNGYVAIARIVIKQAYANSPIQFVIAQRNLQSVVRVNIQFQSVNGLDPGVAYFTYQATSTQNRYFLYKAATSTWDLYVQKTEAYDIIDVVRLLMGTYAIQHLTVTPTNTMKTSALSWTNTATKVTD